MRALQCRISNSELMESYGYEPCGAVSIETRWRQLCSGWTPAVSPELGALRQAMLRTHLELYPDDERWT